MPRVPVIGGWPWAEPRPPQRETLGILPVAALLALGVVAVGTYVVRDLQRYRDESARSNAALARGLSITSQLQYETQETRRTVLYALGTTDANEQVGFAQQSRRSSAEVLRLLEAAESLSDVPHVSELLAALRSSWAEFLVIRDDVIGHLLEGDTRQGVHLELSEGSRRFSVVEAHVQRLAGTFEARAGARVQAVSQQTARTIARVAVLWFAALAGVLSTLLVVQRRMAIDRVVQEDARRIALLEVMLDAVVSVDADGRVVEANSKAEQTFGLTSGTVVGRRLDELVVTDFEPGEPLAETLTRRCGDSADGLIEVAGRRGDGSAFPLELRMVEHPVHDRPRFTAHARDATARRDAEAELRRAKQAAEAASAAKGAFVATISHEIRTPLNAIIGMISLLGESPLTPKQKEWLAAGRASGQGLLAVLDRVLDLSRIEAGQLELDPQPTDVRGVIDEVLDIVSVTASVKRLELRVTMERSAPAAVVVDTTRVRQVLLNLMDNAVKFTGRGGVDLRVSATPLAAGSADVLLCFVVRDTGPGLTDEQASRLFKGFSQGERSTSRRYGGSGLGLAISRQLARLLGGDLTVQSQAGVGTAFSFTCRARPIAMEADAAEREEPGPGIAAEDATLAARHPLRILLAEDDEANRRVLCDLVGHFGYEADVATDGDEAVRLARQRDLDLVLMDLQMPTLGGADAARLLLASLPPERRPRVVAVSASADLLGRLGTVPDGFSGAILKPVRLDVLRQVLLETRPTRETRDAPSGNTLA